MDLTLPVFGNQQAPSMLLKCSLVTELPKTGRIGEVCWLQGVGQHTYVGVNDLNWLLITPCAKVFTNEEVENFNELAKLELDEYEKTMPK